MARFEAELEFILMLISSFGPRLHCLKEMRYRCETQTAPHQNPPQQGHQSRVPTLVRSFAPHTTDELVSDGLKTSERGGFYIYFNITYLLLIK